MSLLGMLGIGGSSTSSKNTTSQTDARSVSDQSGAVVGSTITYNLYGTDAAALFRNNSQSAFGSIGQALGSPTPGAAESTEGGVAALMQNPLILGGGAVLLLMVAMMGKR